MGLISFKIENQKSIQLAESTEIPSVMIIAGQNGVGKSTLLYGIRNGGAVTTSGTKVYYQGPHRALRNTNVQRRWLGGTIKSMLELLNSGDVSGYEGLSFQNSSRTPGNIDEAGSTIKHTLGKIENRRQSILSSMLDKSRISKSNIVGEEIPNIYEPLEKLTKYLLPHLVFSKIDFSDEDNIRCLWKRIDSRGEVEIDIDELSSGEKSIIILFLPLLEDQIKENLKILENFPLEPDHSSDAPNEDRVMLIDEPEQHLHPDLQAKILTYIRNLSLESRVQFIITTHSPSILDQAFDNELFALSAPSSDPTENQLKRIATNADRLETLKQLAGSTYFLTTGRIIICIEGEDPLDTDEPTDIGLLEIMYPRATAFTLVPAKGKGNVINTVVRLRDHVPEETFRIRVRGLVDRDQSLDNISGVEALPVCMIENLLLDPEAIFDYFSSIGIANFESIESVENELRSIANSMKEDEIRIRVARKIKAFMIRLSGSTVDSIKEEQAKQIAAVEKMLPDDDVLEKIISEITDNIEQILSEKNELNIFRGKNILKEIYKRHVSSRNIGYKETCINIAKNLAIKDRVTPRLDPIFDKLSS